MRAAGLLVTFSLLAGCVRDEAEAVCPAIGAGDLVVTELAGPQTGNSLPPWIELYNASGASIDLLGVKLRFRRLDGSSENTALVRRSLIVAPGSYTALGLDDDADLDGYLDYGFAADYHESWLGSAVVDIEACGERVDRARYDSLPRAGSYALGTAPPTAEANDLPANWCTDPTIDAVGATPGSPQQANPTCP